MRVSRSLSRDMSPRAGPRSVDEILPLAMADAANSVDVEIPVPARRIDPTTPQPKGSQFVESVLPALETPLGANSSLLSAQRPTGTAERTESRRVSLLLPERSQTNPRRLGASETELTPVSIPMRCQGSFRIADEDVVVDLPVRCSLNHFPNLELLSALL